MKILSVEQIRAADNYTIKNEPILSIDLMERASIACYNWLKARFTKNDHFKVFCGQGNNGGDGLALARLLIESGFNTEVYLIDPDNKIEKKHHNGKSKDVEINLKRIGNVPSARVLKIESTTQFPEIKKSDIVIDAVLGSGLSNPLKGLFSNVCNKINESNARVISIDVPSGMYCDKRNDDINIIRATHTLTFQLPKFSFLFPENFQFVGHWHILPIGLNDAFINQQKTDLYYCDKNLIKSLLKLRSKFDHKGIFGHSLLIGGSMGKIGASVLASRAALRSGTGLLTVHVPLCGYEILQSTVPEAMVSVDVHKNCFTHIFITDEFDAVAIGPGLSQNKKTQEGFYKFLKNCTKPLVIDADGINILGKNKKWISSIPKDSILTPHLGEFERLAGKTDNDYERHELAKRFSKKNKVFIVLKGAHTGIYCPDGETYFNSTGNPGMATAGSGDVLTGVILGLLSQGYSSKDACILGVYIHGLAGDFAACKKGEQSLIASDIIENISFAFLDITDNLNQSF